MISRRNIRVKVMQTLYTLSLSENGAKPGEAHKLLQQHFDQSRSLLVYLTWFLTEVTRYAETDAHQRASKHLPSADDLNVNTKLAGNEILWKMLEDNELKSQFAKDKPELMTNRDLIRRTYLTLAETPEYKTYISKGAREKQEEKKILEFILNDLMLANEVFVSHIEEHFSNWDDDADMMDQLTLNYLHKPGAYSLQQVIGEEKTKFAKSLLNTTVSKGAYAIELIKPRLQNWDSDRIAVLDMILMQMGVCEFLYFETIPPKVTINEYIDIAKEYSTPQSGHFVNGILDSIHKELLAENKIHKIDFKQKA